jgi:hypothetical protein
MNCPPLTRKQFIGRGLALAGAPLLQACSSPAGDPGYKAAIRSLILGP